MKNHPNLKLKINGIQTPVLKLNFPAGESLIQVDHRQVSSQIDAVITLRFRGNEDLIDLLLLTDAVRRIGTHKLSTVSLVSDYLPYARQDRVCNPGESLSVKVIADLINSQNYSCVSCMDLHSDVSAALLNNLDHREIWDSEDVRGCAILALNGRGDCSLVSPDAGSNKNFFKLAKVHGFKDVVRADKIRDVKTGAILETKVYSEHVGGRDFLIIDDICDGGRTFIELSKELRKLTTGKIYLYVTHGIFSNGSSTVAHHFDQIYTANLIGNTHPSIQEI